MFWVCSVFSLFCCNYVLIGECEGGRNEDVLLVYIFVYVFWLVYYDGEIFLFIL